MTWPRCAALILAADALGVGLGLGVAWICIRWGERYG